VIEDSSADSGCLWSQYRGSCSGYQGRRQEPKARTRESAAVAPTLSELWRATGGQTVYDR
jgi:hypothetical protein